MVQVLKFYADWCSPCKGLAMEIANSFIEPYVHSINVEREEELANQYRIRSLPTTIVLSDNIEVGRVVGVDIKKIEALVKQVNGNVA